MDSNASDKRSANDRETEEPQPAGRSTNDRKTQEPQPDSPSANDREVRTPQPAGRQANDRENQPAGHSAEDRETGTPQPTGRTANDRETQEPQRANRETEDPRPPAGQPASVLRWAELTREQLGAILPEALVILPIGATEQHGPYLATGTDALLASTVAGRGAALAAPRAGRRLVLTPALPIGASDHHFPFGGTLSLRQETLLAVLGDLARSVARSGGRRLVLVNGHGGNQGDLPGRRGRGGQ
ncbi:MAG TPA: creatininase family protein [Pseudonocardiaceae bacterium]|jgi:hypothetical protein|nr:creatininase family protein [Pseudonocardiaceae bacterium]